MQDEELILDDEPQWDIDTIIQAVTSAEADGLTPEQILDPNELEAYNEYMEGERKEPIGHYENLVGAIDETALSRIAQDAINWVRWDENTREDWQKRESEGIRLLGVSDQKSGGAAFEGASSVVHPLLAEAVTQFHSRAMAEMWPPEGPVKAIVLGEQSEERIAQAERVQDYMNYQYTEDMPGAFEEEDNLLFRLPLSGSCFKKVYYDPISRKLCSRLIEPADFIVPFTATDLETAPRYTHRSREMHNTVLKKIAAGYYADTGKLTKAINEVWDYPRVKTEIDHTEGRQRTSVDEDSTRHTILEMYVDLDIKGFEDIGEDGKPTGVALPYIVWVNRDDQSVLRIQRNWLPDDENKVAKLNVAHYRFMPGLGFYGYGLLHLIGGIANAATGGLRALLDSAAFANMQGGYRTRDSRVKGGDLPLAPGEWREVDISAEDLSKAFYRVPYEEPSQTLFNLLGYLDDRSSHFIGGDVMTGDANPNAPVGTTLALIEQGGKTFSSIHRRLHVAHRNEFRILARLNEEYLPIEGYPYYTKSGDRHIMPSDFDKRVDIIPVSDPSIISNTQRIVQAQAVMDLAEKHPDKIDMTASLKMMLEVMRVPGYEELLKVDPIMAQNQQKMAELEMQIKEAELRKINAEIDSIVAGTAETNVTAQFQAIQAALQLILNRAAVQPADELLLSAGYKDHNGSPIASLPQPVQVNPTGIDQNTSPQFPPLPPDPAQAQPAQLQQVEEQPMLSPQAGIETSRIEARAEGGPVNPGQPYLVGEQGPEIIIPAHPGHVLTSQESVRYPIEPVTAPTPTSIRGHHER